MLMLRIVAKGKNKWVQDNHTLYELHSNYDKHYYHKNTVCGY
jgi:hypothetical protein